MMRPIRKVFSTRVPGFAYFFWNSRERLKKSRPMSVASPPCHATITWGTVWASKSCLIYASCTSSNKRTCFPDTAPSFAGRSSNRRQGYIGIRRVLPWCGRLEAGRLAWISRRCRVTKLKMVLLLWLSVGSTRNQWFTHTGTFSRFPAKPLQM